MAVRRMTLKNIVLCALFALSLFCIADCKQRFYKTFYIDVPLDHFSFSTNQTFKLRYLVNDTYWNSQTGPILFYTGNEGKIELFAEHTGLIWEMAPRLNALIVFAEHRYYGESMPFGNESLIPKNMGYLTTSQAMADFVDVMYHLLQNRNNDQQNSIIAIGGSYGGMLSAYIRIKYPHIVTGAIAASAPILQFQGLTHCDVFYRITTSVFETTNTSCSNNIRKSWKAIRDNVKTEDDRKWIAKQFNLCETPKSESAAIHDIKNWLYDIYTNFAMVNYPYENDFLAPLPAYPIAAMCQYLQNTTLTGKPLLKALSSSISVYTNFTGKTKCNSLDANDSNGLGTSAWDYQACTEMVMPMCSTGVGDMFENDPWNEINFNNDCKKQWNVLPAYQMPIKEYGGKRLQYASNIIFSNGLLDPWASGGVLRNLSATVVAVLIPEGAHHLDLMDANANDPPSVISARQFYEDRIKQWIN